MKRELNLNIREIKTKAKQNTKRSVLASGKNPLLDTDSPLSLDAIQPQPFSNQRHLSNTSITSSLDDAFSIIADVIKSTDHNQEGEFYSLATRLCNRKVMEDRFVVGTPETSMSPDGVVEAYFAVFDGHSNSYIAEYLERCLYRAIQEAKCRQDSNLKEVDEPTKLSKVLSKAFTDTNDVLLQKLEENTMSGGSTAVVTLVTEKTIAVASVGDSRAFLVKQDLNSRRFSVKTMTEDHRLCNENEYKRVIATGANVMQKGKRLLLEGSFALSRAFGDLNYRKHITAEPSLYTKAVDSDDKYVLMCTDGFWELLGANPDEMLGELITKFVCVQTNLASSLVDWVIKNNEGVNKDNITVLIAEIPATVSSIGETRKLMTDGHFQMFLAEESKEQQQNGEYPMTAMKRSGTLKTATKTGKGKMNFEF